MAMLQIAIEKIDADARVIFPPDFEAIEEVSASPGADVRSMHDRR
jgi:hypothetical protein